MKIYVDKEGLDAVNGLLDLALRTGGVRNFQAVQIVASAVVLDEPPIIPPMQDDADDNIREDGDN